MTGFEGLIAVLWLMVIVPPVVMIVSIITLRKMLKTKSNIGGIVVIVIVLLISTGITGRLAYLYIADRYDKAVFYKNQANTDTVSEWQIVKKELETEVALLLNEYNSLNFDSSNSKSNLEYVQSGLMNKYPTAIFEVPQNCGGIHMTIVKETHGYAACIDEEFNVEKAKEKHSR